MSAVPPGGLSVLDPNWAVMPRVLVAEDERLLAEELRDRLLRLNYAVVGLAASADEAVRLAETELPDLVLMDVRLKGVRDGIDAAAEVTARLGVPVIFLTAHTDTGTVERARATGPYGYLVKPVRERELDITVRMALHKFALETRLKESEERFVTTLLSIGDGVIAVDQGGRVTFINPVAETLTGWGSVDVVGQPISEVIVLADERTREPIPNPVMAALREHGVVTIGDHALLRRRDGSEVPVDDSAAPVRDRLGNVAGAVLVFRDVTEQRVARRALLKAEEELRQAQRMESLGRLAGGVAHDINNMMTVVSGCADLLLEQLPAHEPMRELAEDIKRAGDRSAEIAKQLLAYSRRQIFRPATQDLSAVVAGVEPMLHRLIGEDVTLDVQLAATPGLVNVDRGQIEQVILNLVVNARDAMPHGGRLTIETSAIDMPLAEQRPRALPPGPYVRLTVVDTGIGMDEATRARIFEPFFTTKSTERGTGLGLATVYGIVQASGGLIEAESTPGHGSRFTVYLPMVVPADGGASESTAAPVPGATAATILLVEDEPAVRMVAQRFLERAGYTVISVPDAAAALAEAPERTIDLLVTDAILPGMSGRQLADTLCSERPDLRVLFISGYTEDAVLRQGISADSVAFLPKPFTSSALTDKVRAVLASRTSGTDRAEPQR